MEAERSVGPGPPPPALLCLPVVALTHVWSSGVRQLKLMCVRRWHEHPAGQLALKPATATREHTATWLHSPPPYSLYPATVAQCDPRMHAALSAPAAWQSPHRREGGALLRCRHAHTFLRVANEALKGCSQQDGIIILYCAVDHHSFLPSRIRGLWEVWESLPECLLM